MKPGYRKTSHKSKGMIKFLLTTVATLAMFGGASRPGQPLSREKSHGQKPTSKKVVNDTSQQSIVSTKPSQEKTAPPHSQDKSVGEKPTPKIIVDPKPKPQEKSVESTKPSQDAKRVSTKLSQDKSSSNSSSSSSASPTTASTSTSPNMESGEEGKPGVGAKKGAVIVNPFLTSDYKPLPHDFIIKYPFLMEPNFWRTIVNVHRETKEGEVRETKIRFFKVEQFKSSYPDGNESLKQEHMQLVLKQVRSEDEKGKHDLNQEYNALRRLNHPNIVRCYGIHNNEAASTVSLVMEGTEHMSIEKLVKRKYPLTSQFRKKFLWEVYTAMKYMNSKGIVHRDLKLENLIIMSDGMVRVIDFGLSMILPSSNVCIPPKKNMANVAPEEFFPETCGTVAADLWSFGVLLVDMLGTNGRLKGFNPFANETHEDHVYKTIDAADMITYLPGSSDAYPIVKSLLERNPHNRLAYFDEAAIKDLLLPKDSIYRTTNVETQSPSASSSVRRPYEAYVEQQMAKRRPTHLGSNSSMHTQSGFEAQPSTNSSVYNGNSSNYSQPCYPKQYPTLSQPSMYPTSQQPQQQYSHPIVSVTPQQYYHQARPNYQEQQAPQVNYNPSSYHLAPNGYQEYHSYVPPTHPAQQHQARQRLQKPQPQKLWRPEDHVAHPDQQHQGGQQPPKPQRLWRPEDHIRSPPNDNQ